MTGLVSSFAGRMWLFGIFAFVGLLFSGFLTLTTHLRKGLPLTSQTNQVTGVREHGFGRWFVTFAAFFSAPWLAAMGLMSAVHYTRLAVVWLGGNLWVLAIPAVLLVLVGGFWWLIRRDAQHERTDLAELHVTPQPTVEAAPTPIWTMPEVDGNWAER